MADPVAVLSILLGDAIVAAFGEEYAGTDPVLRPSDRSDYQANVAMSLAKRTGKPPRDIAQSILERADLGAVCDEVEVAGPGFINLRLRPEFLGAETTEVLDDEQLGIVTTATPQRVVVEYSQPNVAKEMHVGHLRSTVIGDALVRVLSFLGHEVIRQNHIGDWGTPFGMLIEHLVDMESTDPEAAHSISDLNDFYQQARVKFDGDPEFADRSRKRVVAFQGGDPETLEQWKLLVEASLRHMQNVYDRLGVLLTREDVRGESFYNSMLDDIADDLERRGIAHIDDGALCAFPEGFTKPDSEPLPLIIRKSDGGYGYAATDLAQIRFRIQQLKADRLIYVVDARQSQHFAMYFAVARSAGWLPDDFQPEHVAFGSVMGPDKKPLKTRAGETVKLVALLDEATERALDIVREKSPHLDEATQAEVARIVGIGAVKYADLSTHRVRDYVFDWERMLSFEGNTAPYLQYAYARIRSIFRKAERSPDQPVVGPVIIGHDAERALAIQLLAFPTAVEDVVDTLEPHRLCTYLFETASRFTSFYEQCPVLRAEEEETMESRLALCHLTADTISTGLNLLGIGVPDRM